VPEQSKRGGEHQEQKKQETELNTLLALGKTGVRVYSPEGGGKNKEDKREKKVGQVSVLGGFERSSRTSAKKKGKAKRKR